MDSSQIYEHLFDKFREVSLAMDRLEYHLNDLKSINVNHQIGSRLRRFRDRFKESEIEEIQATIAELPSIKTVLNSLRDSIESRNFPYIETLRLINVGIKYISFFENPKSLLYRLNGYDQRILDGITLFDRLKAYVFVLPVPEDQMELTESLFNRTVFSPIKFLGIADHGFGYDGFKRIDQDVYDPYGYWDHDWFHAYFQVFSNLGDYLLQGKSLISRKKYQLKMQSFQKRLNCMLKRAGKLLTNEWEKVLFAGTHETFAPFLSSNKEKEAIDFLEKIGISEILNAFKTGSHPIPGNPSTILKIIRSDPDISKKIIYRSNPYFKENLDTNFLVAQGLSQLKLLLSH